MKKKSHRKTVLLAVTALAAAAVIAIVALVLLLTRDKTPATAEQFTEALLSRGIVCQDITAELQQEAKEYEQGLFSETADFLAEYYLQAEYYRLVSESAAARFAASVRSVFEAQKGSTAAETSANLANYAIYSLTTNGSYYYIAQVDQTVVLFVADGGAKDAVKAIVKDLGY